MFLNNVAAIAARDFIKFLRDPTRIVASLIFPVIFVVIMGGSLDANLGEAAGYSLILFTFTGIYAQTLFQSAAIGVISLIEDRENDFSQEIFVSPASRYAIVIGKIFGETLVAMAQGIAILLFGILVGVRYTLPQLAGLWLIGGVVCFFGGAFGIMILANMKSQRAANQVFPFIMLPQFFLSGAFTPIAVLPWYLDFLSRISPMRYAVDITRAVYYEGHPDASAVVLDSFGFNLALIAAMFVVFLFAGTAIFVRSERNR
jgi:ABC-2 type transport system permease protein